MAVRMRRSRGPSIGLVFLLSAACNRSDEAHTAAAVHLTEHVELATIESAIDLSDRDALVERGTVPLAPPVESFTDFFRCFGPTLALRVPGIAVEDAGSIDYEATVNGDVLTLNGAAAVGRMLPDLGTRRVLVRARLDADPDAEFRILVLAVPRRPGGRDKAEFYVRDLLEAQAGRTHELRRVRSDEGEGSWFACSFQLSQRFRYVFGLFAVRGEVRLLEFECRLTSPLIQALTKPNLDFDSPWVRRVEVASDLRESFVFVTPGAITMPVRIPERGGRLEFSIASVVANGPGFVTRVAARRGDAELCSVELTVEEVEPGTLPAWRDLSLDLEAAAGEEVDLVFSGEVRDDPDGNVGIAVGVPTLVFPGDFGSRSDVVIVSLDTVRADRLSLYGYPKPTTPRLAEIGGRSAVFDAAIASSSWTLPSHATLFSGLLPDRHRVAHASKRIGRSVSLLAEEFRANGYRTVAVTGGGFVHPSFGFGAGFDEYRVYDPVPSRSDGPSGAYELGRRGRQRVMEILRAPRDRPLFLFVHTYVAHEYNALREDLAAIGVAEADLDERIGPTERKSLRGRMQDGDPRDFQEELYDLSVRYDATLRRADALAGDVFDSIEASERSDDTYLFVVSDHGEELAEHGGYGHGHELHEELIRVPFVCRGPGIVASRFDDVVSLADVAPTLRALCGLPAVDSDGRDLSPLFTGSMIMPEPAMAAMGNEWEDTLHVLRDQRWKLKIVDPPNGERRVSLFDLASDGEGRDVAGTMGDRVERMTAALEERIRQQEDAGAGTEQSSITEEMEAELRELGYLGDR